MKRLIKYVSLIVMLYLSSCCEGPAFASSDPIFFTNNSSETIIGLFTYYDCDGYDPLIKYPFKCRPNEKVGFPFTRHYERPIAVKIYRQGDVDFETINYLPAEPLACYLLWPDELRKHQWSFTYPPSEEWMQSGIEDLK